jgi:hypothetical protein
MYPRNWLFVRVDSASAHSSRTSSSTSAGPCIEVSWPSCSLPMKCTSTLTFAGERDELVLVAIIALAP